MEGLQTLIAAYLRQSWQPLAVGFIAGLIVGVLL